MNSIHGAGKHDGPDAIVAGPDDPDEAEEVRRAAAGGGGSKGDLARSIEVLHRVETPRRFIQAACWAITTRVRDWSRYEPETAGYTLPSRPSWWK